MSIGRPNVLEYLDEKYVDDFGRWAFGDDVIDDDNKIFNPCERWNERHGDKLRLYPDDDPKDDLPKMIELWKAHK